MPKAKTAHKSKPAKKTFHKHVAEKPVTPTGESASQTTPPNDEKVIQPEAQSESQPEPTEPTSQPVNENTATVASEITSPDTEIKVPEIAETVSANTTEPTLTPAPEDPENPETLTPSPIMDENDSKSKKPLIFIIIVVILIVIAGLYSLYNKKLKTESAKTQPTPTAQTLEPSPEPSPQELNRADWTLEVLNGSSKKGAAAVLADKLIAKGYQVIKTGNNPEDLETSQVFFTDSMQNQADLFLEDIKEDLENPTNAGNLDDSTASARIIIGAQ